MNYSQLDVLKSTEDNTSDIFKFEDQVYAGYFSYSNKSGIFNYNLGLRTEYTRYQGTPENAKSFDNNYFDFFPSLNMTIKLWKDNQINVGYSRSITRPGLSMYNPFIEKLTNTTSRSGNPEIKPTYRDRVEISKNFELPSVSLNSSAYYEYAKDLVNSPSSLIKDSIYYSYPRNNENIKKIGLSISSSINIFKWFRISPGVSFSRNYADYTRTDGEKIFYNYNFSSIRLNSYVTLWYDIKANLYFSMYPGYKVTTYKAYDSYYSNLSVNKNFFDRKLSLSINVTNVIRYNPSRESFDKDIHTYSKSSPSNQIVSLSLSYNFNKYKNQKEKAPDADGGAYDY